MILAQIFIRSKNLGAVSIRKTVLPGMAIPMLKIRRPNAVLSLTWKSPYVYKMVFILRRGPVWQQTFNKPYLNQWWSKPMRCIFVTLHQWVDHKNSFIYDDWKIKNPGPRFNIKMSSYQYRKSHCGDKTVVRSSYLHNGISYTGKMTSLYWIGALDNHVHLPNANIHN